MIKNSIKEVKLMKRILKFILALIFLLSMFGISYATTITFDNLGGNNGDVFTGYAESGFSVTPGAPSPFQDNNWNVAKIIGNPVPDIYYTTQSGIILVAMTNSGLFTFSSMDLGSNSANNGLTYSIKGFLNNAILFQSNRTFDTITNVFETYYNNYDSYSTILMDKLVIEISGPGSSIYLDNIVVNSTAVPEPTTMLLLGLGLVGIAGVRRKFRK
jgi:hypothetical protein